MGDNVTILRQQLRAGIIASGSTAGEADQALDLAFHAASEAMARLQLALTPLQALGATWGIAYSIALQILPMVCAGALKELAEHCEEKGERTSQILVDTSVPGTVQ